MLVCDGRYIGELARTFGERIKEHFKAPSPIHGHHSTTCLSTTLHNFSIVSREGQGFTRTIKESMITRVNNPTPNRNIDKYNIPHIWDGVLNNTLELQVKKQ